MTWIGATIKLTSGGYFDFLNPTVDMIDINDIAVALSRTCRFGGHGSKPLSVAEHVCNCAEEAVRRGLPWDAVMAVLLHDSTEAYVGDMVKPLKEIIPKFKEIEAKIEATLASKFGVDFHRWHSEIKSIDIGMLLKEREALFGESDGVIWFGETEYQKCDHAVIKHLYPRAAEAEFLNWYYAILDGTTVEEYRSRLFDQLATRIFEEEIA